MQRSSHAALIVLTAISLCGAARAGAAAPPRYFELINRAHDSVTAVAVAETGSQAFQDQPLGAAIAGGGDAATIGIRSDACRHDFRFTFRNDKVVVYPDVDVCRYRSLRIQPLR